MPLRQPRALGRARVSSRARDGQSVLGDLHQSGALKLLFPRVRGAALQSVLLNSAGGVTGGDRFALAARAEAGSTLTLTTQAAERIYRAQPGETGRIDTRLELAPGARLDWLPQETLIYDGAALDRRLRIDMAPDARLLACETLAFGRLAMGERLGDIRLRDRIDLFRGGKLIFADRLRLSGDAEAQLDRPAVLDGARAMATVICAAPGIGDRVPTLRAELAPGCGLAAPDPDLIVARLTARDGFDLRRQIVPLLARLGADPLPRTWML